MIYYFMGIDGSGKSSILDEIDRRLRDKNYETLKIWARYSPFLVKIFVNIFRKRTINRSADYHSISPEEYTAWQSNKRKISRSPVMKQILLRSFFLDYYFQIIRVFHRIRKNRDKIILLDRFVIDFLADQTVNFGDITDTRMYRTIISMCERFDGIFLISVTPGTALERKNDIPGHEYLYERDLIYRKIFKELKKGYLIDNNGDPEIAINEILNIIMA
ncbi:MAG TPA: hypothetical protein DDW27_20955 [Bacteroidales bacterium]|nr:hypothetical protein [Bacteroidales bacterium]